MALPATTKIKVGDRVRGIREEVYFTGIIIHIAGRKNQYLTVEMNKGVEYIVTPDQITHVESKANLPTEAPEVEEPEPFVIDIDDL